MTFSVTLLDDGLRPVGELGRVASVEVERDGTDDTCLLESCTMEVDADAPAFEAVWCRVTWSEMPLDPLGTFRLELDSASVDHGRATLKLRGWSVLKPCDERTLPNGSYCPGGSDAAAFVVGLLGDCPGTVAATGACPLRDPVVFDDGATALEAAWQVLDRVGWCLRADGDGNVTVGPLPATVALALAPGALHGLQPGVDVGDSVSYVREYVGSVRPFDLVTLDLPEVGVSRRGRVLTQSLTLGEGVTVDEEMGTLERGES